MKRRSWALDRESLATEIAGLSKVGTDQLRKRWEAICGKAPSREIGRAFLTRAIAYDLQERTYGGLKPSIGRVLSHAVDETATGSAKRPRTRTAQTGTILIRECLAGLGIFRKRKLKARMGRNPATGEQIKIPARTRLRFTPAKVLKDSVLSVTPVL
jgi:hypothetical protein